MLFARMSAWIFKKGQREEGLTFLAERSSEMARNTPGYRGFMQLLCEKSADCATIITLWESEEARNHSSKGVFKDAMKRLEPYIDCPPEVSNFILSNGELRI